MVTGADPGANWLALVTAGLLLPLVGACEVAPAPTDQAPEPEPAEAEPTPPPIVLVPNELLEPFLPPAAEPTPPAGPELIYGFMDEGTIELADALLEDCWQPAPYDMVCFDGLLTWTEDPYDEKYWRFVVYALRPLRHLVYARQVTGDPVYSDKIVDILWSFVDSGVTASAFWDKHTAAFRALVLVNLYFKLDRWEALPPDLAEALDDVLHDNAAFLANPANYESSFNHGFNEAVALLCAAENFPEWPESTDWQVTARTRLVTLMSYVIDPDGVEREQSPYYHLYVMAKAWELYRWSDSFDIHLPDEIVAPLPAMIRYATLVADPAGDVPMVGASALGNLATYSPPVFDQIADAHPEFAWVRSGGTEGVEPTETFVLFEDSGQRIMRTGFGEPPGFATETHLFFDVGIWRTNHAHLDGLHLRLYAGGRTVLPDSGLFTYEAGGWHDHFWGTSAHNTVVVDGGDQDNGTAAPVLAEEGPGWLYQSGRHELYEGVVHSRGVALLERDVVLVVDRLRSDDDHLYEQLWHLPPGPLPDAWPPDTEVFDPAGEPILRILQADPDTTTAEAIAGSTDPPLGWISYSYEVKEPAPVLRYTRSGADVWFATLLLAGEPAGGDPTIELAVQAGFDGAQVALLDLTTDGGAWDVSIADLGEPNESLSVVEVAARGPEEER